jgi:hypothetical protein
VPAAHGRHPPGAAGSATPSPPRISAFAAIFTACLRRLRIELARLQTGRERL